ncbi:helix-turn-helix domain-containing protein [Microbacterium gilvum]
MPEAPASRYLSPAQVAELLDLEPDEVLELIAAGRLRGARLGAPARWRVERASVEEYLVEQHEDSRRRALWRESNAASFPELWVPRRER